MKPRLALAKQLASMPPHVVEEVATQIAKQTRAGLRGEDLAEALRGWAKGEVGE